ncbi:MAG: hypothetical protein ACUVRV_00120 [Cyanobacteriota bacterium]
MYPCAPDTGPKPPKLQAICSEDLKKRPDPVKAEAVTQTRDDPSLGLTVNRLSLKPRVLAAS